MARPPHRFYYPGVMGSEPGEAITLPEGESHHLLHVFRLRPGAVVSVFDSHSNLWNCEVLAAEGKQALVGLVERLESEPAAGSPLMMAVSLLKRRSMDWMIEKLAELDVVSVQPLICRRTVATAPKSAALSPPPRWERISLSAAKQAGRTTPMTFNPVCPLPTWLGRERPRVLSCFAHKGPGAVEMRQWLGDRAGMNLPVLVAVGPEGGWTPGEVAAFKAAGFQAVSLGPLVLRAETAAITVAAACRVML